MESLEELRKSIDNIDNAILAMLAERFRVTDRVGQLKAQHNIPAQDAGREAAQYERIRSLAVQYGVDPDFAESYLTAVIEHVVQNHQRIAQQRA